jgi:hypothetical protein
MKCKQVDVLQLSLDHGDMHTLPACLLKASNLATWRFESGALLRPLSQLQLYQRFSVIY